MFRIFIKQYFALNCSKSSEVRFTYFIEIIFFLIVSEEIIFMSHNVI